MSWSHWETLWRCLVSPLRRDAARWQGMWEQFDRMGLSQVDREGYAALYS